MRSALSAKLSEEGILVVESLSLESPKTKEFNLLLKRWNLTGGVLVVHDQNDENLRLASRNLPDVKLVSPSQLNIFDVLKYKTLLISRSALEHVERIFKK